MKVPVPLLADACETSVLLLHYQHINVHNTRFIDIYTHTHTHTYTKHKSYNNAGQNKIETRICETNAIASRIHAACGSHWSVTLHINFTYR